MPNKTQEIIIGQNIYTVEFGRDIEKGEPFIYQQNQVIIAQNGINVHDNSSHFAITKMKKIKNK